MVRKASDENKMPVLPMRPEDQGTCSKHDDDCHGEAVRMRELLERETELRQEKTDLLFKANDELAKLREMVKTLDEAHLNKDAENERLLDGMHEWKEENARLRANQCDCVEGPRNALKGEA